jgi:hypothetical protein
MRHGEDRLIGLGRADRPSLQQTGSIPMHPAEACPAQAKQLFD